MCASGSIEEELLPEVDKAGIGAKLFKQGEL